MTDRNLAMASALAETRTRGGKMRFRAPIAGMDAPSEKS